MTDGRLCSQSPFPVKSNCIKSWIQNLTIWTCLAPNLCVARIAVGSAFWSSAGCIHLHRSGLFQNWHDLTYSKVILSASIKHFHPNSSHLFLFHFYFPVAPWMQQHTSSSQKGWWKASLYVTCPRSHNVLYRMNPVRECAVHIYTHIQGDPGGKDNILVRDNMGHCETRNSHEHASNSAWFPVGFSNIYYKQQLICGLYKNFFV